MARSVIEMTAAPEGAVRFEILWNMEMRKFVGRLSGAIGFQG